MIGSDPPSLDPRRTPSVGLAHALMYETLVTADRRTGEFIPALAESWEISRDGTVMTFKLRRGVRFHDGTPFNAAAVKATFDRLTSRETNAPGASWVGTLSRTEVVDDLTVRLVFSRPYAPSSRRCGSPSWPSSRPRPSPEWGWTTGRARSAPAPTGSSSGSPTTGSSTSATPTTPGGRRTTRTGARPTSTSSSCASSPTRPPGPSPSSGAMWTSCRARRRATPGG